MSRRVRAYIGLGANVGDRRANIERAITALGELPSVRVRRASPLYQTKPMGETDQPDFLNAVASIEVKTNAEPAQAAQALLGDLKRIERELGRRQRQRWGPREIDLDLLIFGRHRIERAADPWLVVPHPLMASRLFVLAPLADLAPRLRPPGWRESVSTTRDRRLQVEGSVTVRRLDG